MANLAGKTLRWMGVVAVLTGCAQSDPGTAEDRDKPDDTDDTDEPSELDASQSPATGSKDSGPKPTTPVQRDASRPDAARPSPSPSDASVEVPLEPGTGGDAGVDVPEVPAEPEVCDKNLEPKPGDTMCSSPLKPGDDRLCEFSFSGAMRKFYVYAPKSYNPCKPAALVMDAHGASESAEVHTGKAGFQANSPKGYGSGWRMAVQGDNAIVVTPQGVSNFWNEGSDPAYVNAAAELVKKMADIDPNKMYMTGISMGGMMTYANSCTAMSQWRGMVPIAMLANTCPSLPKPVPLISFHAPTDSITSYDDDRANTEKVAKLNNCKNGPKPWAKFGGASSDPRPYCFAMPPKLGSPDAPDPAAIPFAPCPTSAPEADCVGWDGCDEGVEVVFCSVPGKDQQYGGHLLYNNDTGLNLPQVAWPFLKKFWK